MFFLFRNLDIEGQYEKNNRVDAEEKYSKNDGGDLVGISTSTGKNNVDQDHYCFSQLWRIILGVSCVIAVSLDPSFFYIPVIDEDKKCIGLDKKLRSISLILRAVSDIIGVINIILQFHEKDFKEENFGKATLLKGKDRQKKARRSFWLYVLIDIFVILPFPQVRESFLQLMNLFMEKCYFITMMIIIFFKIN